MYRIHNSLYVMHSNPLNDAISDNARVLAKDLATISARSLRHGLSGYVPQNDIDALADMVTKAQQFVPASTGRQNPSFATEIQGTAWETLLSNAASALNDTPCGALQNGTTRHTVGQSQNNAPSDPRLREPVYPLIRNPVQLGFATLLAVLTGILMMRQIALWLRRRAVLEKRRSKRFTTRIASQVIWSDASIEVTIVDLSCHGAKLKYSQNEAMPPGTQISVCIAKKPRSGKTVWSNEHYTAVAFTDVLPIPLVRDLAHIQPFDGLGRLIKMNTHR